MQTLFDFGRKAVGKAISTTGTAIGAPELGISEAVAGNPAPKPTTSKGANSGIPLGPNYLIGDDLYNAAGDYLGTRVKSETNGATDGSGTLLGGGGAAAGSSQDQLDEQAYWDDQLGNADRQLARLPIQRLTGEQNIDSSYQTAYDRLLGDKAITERDYTTKKDQTREDNIAAKTAIDTSVRNTNTGLQRLLGAKGAGNSSAATILAPFAAAKQGNVQRGQVSQAFGRNQQALDTAFGDYGQEWDESVGDLGVQRDSQKKLLESGIASSEADLVAAKADAAVQRGQAGGQTYAQARSARAPYVQRIDALIKQIDSLGANPTFTPKTAAYKAPELASYDYNRYAAPTTGSGVDPGLAQGAGAYWTLLNKKKEQLAA